MSVNSVTPKEKWERCLGKLKEDFSAKDFSTWFLPLHLSNKSTVAKLILLAPNEYVLDSIKTKFLTRIEEILADFFVDHKTEIMFSVGDSQSEDDLSKKHAKKSASATSNSSYKHTMRSYLNQAFTFDNFIEGRSNQLAYAGAMQVANSVGKAYNPLFIYGGVGLGKTHLMHAIGNKILQNDPDAKVLYLHAERFVSDMVKALQKNTIDEFKKFYRSLNALLLDDIQFFSGKERTQEEFFHTFNALFEGQNQIILTSDRYPKEMVGVEERLKSRFGWGLTVAIEPPELETRIAILLNKAEQSNIKLSHEVAFFVAKHVQANVRELEGALKRIIANAHFTGKPITLNFAKDTLHDLLAVHSRLVTIENIQKTTAEYFKIRLIDLNSKTRERAIVRPRQMAMALAKELTNHSLPEIAEVFGGRDHTTVLHASRKIKELIQSDQKLAEDYRNLVRVLTA